MKTFLLIIALGTQIVCAAQVPDFIKTDLEKYIMTGMKDWQVPALSLVIVKDGQVVLRNGYGVRDLEKKEPVDENTLFFIASNSKLFTGTALAHLQYHKKLNLNDKITKYFPDYRLYDDLTTQQVSIRDMLTHRIGTKTFQGDFTFWNTTLSSKEIMQRMRLLKPTGIFRQDYGYCNSCFLTAGEVIPKVTGSSWFQYVTDSIMKPLGMNNSYASTNGIRSKVNNMAVPYTTSFTGMLNRVPDDNWDNLGPAASIVSNVKDLTNWLLMQLDSGRFESKQILPWQVLQATRDVQIITNSRKSSVYPMHFRGYGLGLNIADYNGRQVYWHTGGAAGMVSNVCFVPEEKLGIAILTTNDNQSFFEALRYQILDAFLDVQFVNRSEVMLKQFKSGEKETLDSIAAWKNRAGKKDPSIGWEPYTGTYNHELYGNLTIEKKGASQLLLKLQHHPGLTGTLSYMGNKEWLLEFSNIEYGIFKVKFEREGTTVKSFEMKVNDFVEYDTYKFIKK
ncbi:MAG: serine hydrolase [Chitinophagaceae bacterium]|nr:serine hydrolase [Chitinophagaceae bacterium]